MMNTLHCALCILNDSLSKKSGSTETFLMWKHKCEQRELSKMGKENKEKVARSAKKYREKSNLLQKETPPLGHLLKKGSVVSGRVR